MTDKIKPNGGNRTSPVSLDQVPESPSQRGSGLQKQAGDLAGTKITKIESTSSPLIDKEESDRSFNRRAAVVGGATLAIGEAGLTHMDHVAMSHYKPMTPEQIEAFKAKEAAWVAKQNAAAHISSTHAATSTALAKTAVAGGVKVGAVAALGPVGLLAAGIGALIYFLSDSDADKAAKAELQTHISNSITTHALANDLEESINKELFKFNAEGREVKNIQEGIQEIQHSLNLITLGAARSDEDIARFEAAKSKATAAAVDLRNSEITRLLESLIGAHQTAENLFRKKTNPV